MLAIKHDKLELAIEFLDKILNVDLFPPDIKNMVERSLVLNNSRNILQYLISQNITNPRFIKDRENTPLYFAIQKGKVNTTILLLSYGAYFLEDQEMQELRNHNPETIEETEKYIAAFKDLDLVQNETELMNIRKKENGIFQEQQSALNNVINAFTDYVSFNGISNVLDRASNFIKQYMREDTKKVFGLVIEMDQQEKPEISESDNIFVKLKEKLNIESKEFEHLKNQLIKQIREQLQEKQTWVAQTANAGVESQYQR